MELHVQNHIVKIDDEDYDKIQQYHWSVRKHTLRGTITLYIYGERYVNKVRERVSLHRYVMGCNKGDGTVVDHINHDTFDNRKCNLRICTPQENTRSMKISTRNTSGYKGVNYTSSPTRWLARIQLRDGKRVSLGTYNTKEEAAKAYDRGALFYFGEYAITNFPKEQYLEETRLAREKYIAELKENENVAK